MVVVVRLGEPLWRAVQSKEVPVELPQGATVRELLARVRERYPTLDEVMRQSDLPPTVFLGDELAEMDTSIEEGARPTIVWAMAGG